MKLQKIYSLMAGSLVLFAACSPDDYGFGNAQYTADDLTCPDAYTVTINGNKVDLASKISGCTPLWVTPSGRSEQQNLTLELPFAGDYEVTFGADTRAGAIYGDPYKFNIAQNDFSLLSDDKWFFLADSVYRTGDEFPDAATLSAGVNKKWYPNDKDYGLGCTGPVMYMTPYNPTNTENSYTEAEEKNLTYKDITFGRANWSPNWDPGFQSWLIPEDDPYMSSYMEFSMNAKDGCVAKMYRGESGTKSSSTGTTMTGKFNLGLLDKTHPTISFTDCYAMHNLGFDEVCSNYTQDVIIAELTPYYLCLVTKRTNSEGNWYIVWNFVSEEVKNTNGACIPKEESQLLESSDPMLTDYNNIATDAFTVESNGVTYVGNQVTYTVNEDKPYDIMWWNGSSSVNKWQTILPNGYNNTWAPQAPATATENELVFAKKSTGEYTFSYGDTEGTVTFSANKINFSKEVTFFTVSNDNVAYNITGKEFTIISETPAEGMVIGVPKSKDANGNVNSYLCVNLKTKAIGSAQTGPTVVPLNTNYTDDGMSCIDSKKYFRLVFYNTWNSGKGIAKDITKVKLKNGQKLTVKFTLKDASAWSDAPKCAICENCINSKWEPDCYSLDCATTVNLAGETVVTLTNNTGETKTFTDGSLQLSIQLDGYYKDFDGETLPDIIQSVTCQYE